MTSEIARERPHYEGPERRSDNGPFAGLPQWARIVAMVGIPGTISLFLVWVGSRSLPQIQTELIAYRMEAERSREAMQEQNKQSEQIYRMLQRICAEIAKTDEGRSRCFDQ